jgi:hypothetical protein
VLDLAKQGYIKYDALGSFSGGVTLGNPSNAPLYGRLFDAVNFHAGSGYKPALFPQGMSYSPISYSIGAGYIRATRRTRKPVTVG